MVTTAARVVMIARRESVIMTIGPAVTIGPAGMMVRGVTMTGPAGMMVRDAMTIARVVMIARRVSVAMTIARAVMTARGVMMGRGVTRTGPAEMTGRAAMTIALAVMIARRVSVVMMTGRAVMTVARARVATMTAHNARTSVVRGVGVLRLMRSARCAQLSRHWTLRSRLACLTLPLAVPCAP